MPVYDLKCDRCGAEREDEYLAQPLSDDDALRPKCECGGTLHNRSIRLTEAAKARLQALDQVRVPASLRADGFVPFSYEGVHYGSREEWHQRRAVIASNLNVAPEQVVVNDNTRHERNRKYEEAQQRVLDSHRRFGYTPEEARERREYNRRRR
jgi:hypothetical protein